MDFPGVKDGESILAECNECGTVWGVVYHPGMDEPPCPNLECPTRRMS